jgi:hypothetical protein
MIRRRARENSNAESKSLRVACKKANKTRHKMNGPGAEAPGPTRVREEDRAFLYKYYYA